jgi:hypothetical protein
MLKSSELYINQGCNLKWKLGDESKQLSTVQTLLVLTVGYHSKYT